jgi:hypothetical protein
MHSNLQGVIITRGRIEADVLSMGRGSVSQVSTWFLVETNYDHWNQPPFFDDRRTPAIQCLDKMGRETASLSGIFNVLSTKPVFNKVCVIEIKVDLHFLINISNYIVDYLHMPHGCFNWPVRIMDSCLS